jgi:hypothetical protein
MTDVTVFVSDVEHIETQIVEVVHQTEIETIEVGLQGPRGVQGPQGDPGLSGDAALVTAVAAVSLGGHRAVVFIGDESQQVIYADQSIASHAERFLGVTTGAADAVATVTIQTGGELTEPSWNWITGLPVYLSTQGLLTQTPPTTGFLQIVGLALGATRLLIQHQPAFHFE